MEVALSQYERYRIPTEHAPNIADHPGRFKVKVRRHKLAELLIKELIHYRGDLPVVLSRPCVYGVFSGPVGGFAPREDLCVGCLRCTVQYPDVVQIEPNPERTSLGDTYLNPDQVDTLLYEASTGRVPVRGAGYRGAYGGTGWDGMWTDMSEIVRPTRDGIHGREYISTEVDLGPRPTFLEFGEDGRPKGDIPSAFSLPVPFLFDVPPSGLSDPRLVEAWVRGAETAQTLAVLPGETVLEMELDSPAVVPLLSARWEEELEALESLEAQPRLYEIATQDPEVVGRIHHRTDRPVAARIPFGFDVVKWAEAGVDFLHLTADYHGGSEEGFVLGSITSAHRALVEASMRERVSLIGSGGIVAAEHVPKAIICGLDAVALDTPLLIALQARFQGRVRERGSAQIDLPEFEPEWGGQRLANLCASWRDQLLEILGAMGLREVRRLRGETGRAMFQQDLEREAFAGIEGYPDE